MFKQKVDSKAGVGECTRLPGATVLNSTVMLPRYFIIQSLAKLDGSSTDRVKVIQKRLIFFFFFLYFHKLERAVSALNWEVIAALGMVVVGMMDSEVYVVEHLM